jgi:hypothetical protein
VSDEEAQLRANYRDGDGCAVEALYGTVEIDVDPGVHEYVYLVDGVPVVPPEASETRMDEFGVVNGVLYVD